MDKTKLRKILWTGDLLGVNKIDEWVDTAITNCTWNKERETIEGVIGELFLFEDAAFVRALVDKPWFPWLVTSMVQASYPYLLEHNAQFLKEIRDALLPHIGPEHTERLRYHLQHAIKLPYPVEVRELLNALWMKSMSLNECDYKRIIKLYPNPNKTSFRDRNVICTGLSQHIDAVFEHCHDFQDTDKFDRYTQSKLIEWAISAKTSIDQMAVLKR